MGNCVSELLGTDYGVNSEGVKFKAIYGVGPKLGIGSFGIVREVYLKSDGTKTFAAKIITRATEKGDPRAQKAKELEELEKMMADPNIEDELRDFVRHSIKNVNVEISNMTTQVPEEEILEEIAMMRKVQHDRICAMHDMFESPKVYTLILTRCYETLDFAKPYGGWVEEDEPALFFRHLCEALAFLHSKRILHRDVKPENMMLKEDGSAVLCDLGLAWQLADDQEATPLDQLAGTLSFMPPEVWREGQGSPADIWAAGATLYWMLFDDFLTMDVMGDRQVTVRRGKMSTKSMGGGGRRASNAGSAGGLTRTNSKGSGPQGKYAPTPDKSSGGGRRASAAGFIEGPGAAAAQALIERAFSEPALYRCRAGKPPRSAGALSLLKSILQLNHQARPSAKQCLDDSFSTGKPPAEAPLPETMDS